LSGDTLKITDVRNAICFAERLSADADDQTLSISNDTLFIQDGNSVDLGSYLDNMTRKHCL